MAFYWFDVGGAAVILAFAAISWFRGFMRELFSALAWIGGYLAATAFYSPVSKFYQKYMGHPVLADILGFFSVFLGAVILVRIISWLVREKLGLKNLSGWVDGAAGAGMGALKGALFISVLLIPLNYFPSMKSEFMAKSYVARGVEGVSELCYPLFRFDVARSEEILREDIGKIKSAVPSAPSVEPAVPLKDAPATPKSYVPAPRAPRSQIGAQTVTVKAEERPAPQAAAPAAKPAQTPVVKKAEPVKKRQPGNEPEGGDMDDFVKTLR